MLNSSIQIIHPDGKAEDKKLENSAEGQMKQFQKIVGGYFQQIYLSDGRAMILNENGKSEALEPNPVATQMAADVLSPADYIVGSVCIAEPGVLI